MNPALKLKWTQALRSGNFAQAQGTLKNSFGFCCLGVLCHIASQEISDLGFEVSEGDRELTVLWTDEENGREGAMDSELPQTLATRLGIKNQAPLVNMNDGAREFKGNPQSFPQIADWIEEHL